MSGLPAHDQIDVGPAAVRFKFWNRLAEKSTAVIFVSLAAIAMAGWVYLLAEGIWAVAVWAAN